MVLCVDGEMMTILIQVTRSLRGGHFVFELTNTTTHTLEIVFIAFPVEEDGHDVDSRVCSVML